MQDIKRQQELTISCLDLPQRVNSYLVGPYWTNIETLEQLCQLSPKNILQIDGLGEKALATVTSALERIGMSLSATGVPFEKRPPQCQFVFKFAAATEKDG